MNKKSIGKIGALLVVFVGLWFLYGYFSLQSTLGNGKSNADRVIQDIADGNAQDVKDRLIEFVNVPPEQADQVRSLRLALINVDYIAESIDTINFIDHYLTDSNAALTYRAIYSLPAPENTSDYAVVVMRRAGDEWKLSNIVLSAVNPLEN